MVSPTVLGSDVYMNVVQYPHIGLATLTYLLEGKIPHKDSIGSNQVIVSRFVNWMVAGKRCTHTERTSQKIIEKIETAKENWKAHNFPKIANDNSYIPLLEVHFLTNNVSYAIILLLLQTHIF